MKYLSVCSGIEAATVAWHHMGWKPVGFSEIEKFPSQVLAHHYPDVTNFGDMTKYKEWQLNDSIGLLVGGTPCQSFSVAGLRKGLNDPRGNLMLTFLGIADHFKPRWIVWENVPGVLSSNGGKDFGTFLGALGELGYGFAYRVLDAQYFGVAQRRRRVFVVGCLGDWRSAAAVLFDSESLSGNPAPRREKREEVTGTIAARFGISRNNHEQCVAQTLLARSGGFDIETETPILWPAKTTSTLNAAFGKNLGLENQHINQGAPLFVPSAQPIAYAFDSLSSNSMKSSNPISECNQVDVSKTIDTSALNLACNQNGNAVLQSNMAVRRLTPTECERLQGFPDGYTDIQSNGKPTPDGPRYKALGNSMAVPCMVWLGERINFVDGI